MTAEGRFVLEAGQEVNAHTKGDTCTREEMEKDGVQCTGPALHPPGSLGAGVAEPGALASPESVAVGGPEDLVYVGEEHRVQEFETDGKYKREIPLTAISPSEGSQVKALAVNETGDVYLDYRSGGANVEGENTIREFDPAGQQIAGFPLTARSPEALYLLIEALSVSPSGRLAVSEVEDVNTGSTAASFELRFFGSLLEDGNGRLVTEFSEPRLHAAPASVTGSAFGPSEELYFVKIEVKVRYRCIGLSRSRNSLPAPRLVHRVLKMASDVTFACTLAGEANPEGVAGTEVFFELGHTSAFGEVTAKQSVASTGPVSAGVQGLVPDETYYDRLAGEDENSKAPESPLTGETVSFVTPIVAPKILGTPSVSFLTPFSAVFSGELNPENTNTAYEFQYGTCENLDACPGALSTRTLESSAYGQTTTILQARELEPATVYHYRLLASNQHLVAGKPEGGVATGTVGTFTTGPAPVPQAASGPASAAGTTSATITGSVNPDGQPAVYTFEAGLYEGAATQYGVVFTATVDAATTAVPESVGLSGLQPGATYAYRIKITSGYGTAYGETLTFTTQGLPVVLSAPTTPALLAMPAIAFPIPAAAKHATLKHTTRKEQPPSAQTARQAQGRPLAEPTRRGSESAPERKQILMRKGGNRCSKVYVDGSPTPT